LRQETSNFAHDFLRDFLIPSFSVLSCCPVLP
jgi:hypothetical protein